jgi:hypothetical protein
MTTRTLTLAKGDHRYLFRYGDGAEDDIVDAIMRLAEDADCNLDWLDAAALSFQVAHYAAQDAGEFLVPAPYAQD